MNKELLYVLKELGFGHDENDGIDLESRNEIEFTPLMKACIDNNVNAIKVLLKHGANIEAKDNYGSTALQIVISERDKYNETIQILEAHTNGNL